jgi:hypothetical protein
MMSQKDPYMPRWTVQMNFQGSPTCTTLVEDIGSIAHVTRAEGSCWCAGDRRKYMGTALQVGTDSMCKTLQYLHPQDHKVVQGQYSSNEVHWCLPRFIPKRARLSMSITKAGHKGRD